jgi:hypothetical protein
MTPDGPTWMGHIAKTFVGIGSLFDTTGAQFDQIRHLALLPGVIFVWLTPWIIKSWTVPQWVSIVLMSAAAISIAAITVRAFHFDKTADSQGNAHCFVMGTFALVFPLFLIAAILIFGRTFTFDERICLPMMTPALIAMLLAAFNFLKTRPALARCAVIAFAITLMVRVPRAVDRSIQIASSSGAGGQGYHDAKWRSSPTMEMLRKLPAHVTIYSNAPEAVYILTGRSTLWLPHRKGGNYDNSPVDDLLSQTRDDARRGAIVVLFDRLAWRRYSPSREQVCRALEVRPVRSPGDGIICVSPALADFFDAIAPSHSESGIASLITLTPTLAGQ